MMKNDSCQQLSDGIRTPHLSNYVCMHGSQTKSQIEFGAFDGVRTSNLGNYELICVVNLISNLTHAYEIVIWFEVSYTICMDPFNGPMAELILILVGFEPSTFMFSCSEAFLLCTNERCTYYTIERHKLKGLGPTVLPGLWAVAYSWARSQYCRTWGILPASFRTWAGSPLLRQPAWISLRWSDHIDAGLTADAQST